MCITQGGSRGGSGYGGVPVAQPATPAPTKEGVLTAGLTAPPSAVNLLEQTRQIIKQRQGVFGNVATTPMGDASYGTFAAFGAPKKAAA